MVVNNHFLTFPNNHCLLVNKEVVLNLIHHPQEVLKVNQGHLQVLYLWCLHKVHHKDHQGISILCHRLNLNNLVMDLLNHHPVCMDHHQEQEEDLIVLQYPTTHQGHVLLLEGRHLHPQNQTTACMIHLVYHRLVRHLQDLVLLVLEVVVFNNWSKW